MAVLDRLHGGYVAPRRAEVLSAHLARAIPSDARVLDVGAGDGLIAALIQRRRGDIDISGVDVLVRPETHIPVTEYDGTKLPFPDSSFDAVMMVDVLHHVDDQLVVLAEAKRVSRNVIVIKDHLKHGFLAHATLRFMDKVGNARHGVRLPYNYWRPEQWNAAFERLELEVLHRTTDLGLYPPPMHWLFDRSLHFVASLGIR